MHLKKYSDQSDTDFFNNKVNKQVARILQIMEVFVDLKLAFTDTFGTFDWEIVLVITSKLKVRIKAALNNTGLHLAAYAVYRL